MYQRRGALAQLVERMTVKHRKSFLPTTWGISSVGRVPHWQCGCQRFESAMLHQENQASKICLVFFIGKADENRVAVRYRRLENFKRERRNFASRRDAERSIEVLYAPPGKVAKLLGFGGFLFAYNRRRIALPVYRLARF